MNVPSTSANPIPAPKLAKKSTAVDDIIKQIGDLKLNDDIDDEKVVRAQQQIIQYYKSVHKQKMPDIIKATVKVVDSYVQKKDQDVIDYIEGNGKKLCHFRFHSIW